MLEGYCSGIWTYQTGAHWSPFRRGPADLEELQDGACGPSSQGFVSDPANCVNMGGDYNLNGNPGDRPDAVASNVDATGEQWAEGFNLRDSFFSAPCLGRVGNLGRNTFVGPDYWNVDVAVSKTFMLSEGMKLQFRAEAYNIFNRTNFQLPLALMELITSCLQRLARLAERSTRASCNSGSG